MASNFNDEVEQVELDEAEFGGRPERRVTRSVAQQIPKPSTPTLTAATTSGKPVQSPTHEEATPTVVTGRKSLKSTKKMHEIVHHHAQIHTYAIPQNALDANIEDHPSCGLSLGSHSAIQEETRYGSSSSSSNSDEEPHQGQNADIAYPPKIDYCNKTARGGAHEHALVVSGKSTEAKKVIRRRRSTLAEKEKKEAIRKTYYNPFNQSKWPHRKPTIDKMVNAWLEYVDDSEYNDLVRCVKCKGTLYAFQPEDEPGQEHNRYYPSCT